MVVTVVAAEVAEAPVFAAVIMVNKLLYVIIILVVPVVTVVNGHTIVASNSSTGYRYQYKYQLIFSFTALNFTFEADAEMRKARLPPRVDFLGLPRDSLNLPAQKREICTDIKLRFLVRFHCPVMRPIKRSPV